MADSEKIKCRYLTEAEFEARKQAVAQALDGVVASQAIAVLREAEILVCSTAIVGTAIAVEPSA